MLWASSIGEQQKLSNNMLLVAQNKNIIFFIVIKRQHSDDKETDNVLYSRIWFISKSVRSEVNAHQNYKYE